MSKQQYYHHVYSFIRTDGKVRWSYEIRDQFDFVMTHGVELHEIHEEATTNWATEEAADRNGKARVKELNK